MTIIFASSWSSPVDSTHGDLQYGLTVTLQLEHHIRQDFFKYRIPKTYQQHKYMISNSFQHQWSMGMCQKKTHSVQIIDTSYHKQGFPR